MTRIITSVLTALLPAIVAGTTAFSAAPARPEPRPQTVATSAGDAGKVLTLQVRLDRGGFSPGEIDGVHGRNTDRALAVFAQAKGISPQSAAQTVLAGEGDAPTLVPYTIADADVAGPFTPQIPEEIAAQSGLPALGYRDALEALAEKFHSAPPLLRRLNPGRQFAAGEEIRVPNVGDRTGITAGNAVKVEVSKRTMTLIVYEGDAIIFSAPVTSGSEHDPLPIGPWKVKGVARNPPFHYNPALFWDASPADEKALIAPGPNNPVGVVWIDLTKPHYGLHGTPRPELVGHTASHGCVRLTNWDAMTVAGLVRPGTAVIFAE